MQYTLRALKQTLHPPKRTIPLASNPLTRWSRRIPPWPRLAGTLTSAQVGLEGCHSAFNATNSIRTCLYFQTAAPPTFLTAASWRSIEHVQTRSCSGKSSPTSMASSSSPASVSTSKIEENPFTGVAVFGEKSFFAPTDSTSDSRTVSSVHPIVALENFTNRAESLMHTRLPLTTAKQRNCIRLVVGHENWGVRPSLLRPKLSSEEETARNENANLPVADKVVYVPQYGTISSLNVVTSLGIILFYCYIDEHCPDARTVHSPAAGKIASSIETTFSSSKISSKIELHALRQQIQAYQDCFKHSLPTPSSSAKTASRASSGDSTLSTSTSIPSQDVNVNTTPRVDRRPIHPVFYRQEMMEIQQQQQNYRRMLLQYSSGTFEPSMTPKGEQEKGAGDISLTSTTKASPCAHESSMTPAFFGISVLYENEYDQRNFGGLIRNANAFLVDYILYVGRRKYNVVGAVGSYHYTPPVYLGPLPDGVSNGNIALEKKESNASNAAVSCSDNSDNEPAAVEERMDWSASLSAEVNRLYCVEEGETAASPRAWWLLDCGHRFLYEGDPLAEEEDPTQTNAESEGNAASGNNAELQSFAASGESLRRYKALLAARRVHNLCEPEAVLREALSGGVVLVVPQEGKLPHSDIMKLCTGILEILPDGVHCNELYEKAENETLKKVINTGHRGLPSQVASGIALQRLSAVLHPRLAAI